MKRANLQYFLEMGRFERFEDLRDSRDLEWGGCVSTL